MCPDFWTIFGHLLDKFSGKISGTSMDNESLKVSKDWIQFRHIMDTFWIYFGHILYIIWTHFGQMPVGCMVYIPRAKSFDTHIKYILFLQTAVRNVSKGQFI